MPNPDKFKLCETAFMSIIYRTITIEDYPKIFDLWSSSDGVVVRSSDSKESTEKYLSRNQDLSFVAEFEGTVIGSIFAGHDGKRGYIQHLIVSSNHRSKGIGSQLVSFCIDALGELGIVKSHIHVLINNQIAKKFWSKQGWEQREDIVVFSHLNTTDTNA